MAVIIIIIIIINIILKNSVPSKQETQPLSENQPVNPK